jgi:ABC-type branched-subunit amino acid transport system ATPase component/branched-subunit amino acid ABC-type transport system permease component
VHEYLPFLVSGIATGSIFGLAATGLVLTYKTSGIFNFGHGAIATAAAYLFYFLHVDHGWSWLSAFVVAVIVGGPLMGLGMAPVARRLAQQRLPLKIAGTVGLILIVQGLGTVRYGTDTIRLPQYLPKSQDFFEVAGVNVSYPQLWVTLTGLLAAVLLFLLFRYTRTGVMMRAVVDDPDLVAMYGTSPDRVRRISWAIGCTLAAASGALVLPFVGLNAITLTFLVVQAFGAAALGAFSSIPLTFLGGLVIGVAADQSQKVAISHQSLAGLPDSLPFLVLFLVLLLLPKRKLVPPTAVELRAQLQYRAPGMVRTVTGLVVLVPLLLIPQVVDSRKLPSYTVGLTQMVIILSLGLLVRTSGQVSLCHAAFAAIGATAFSQLALQHGVPWFLALLVAGLIVVPVGALVAIPAIRLSGLFLALATFGCGILVERLAYGRGFMFTTLSNGRAVPRPGFANSDRGYYYLVLAFVVVVSLLIVAILHSRLGRVLRGLSESPVAVATLGLSTNTTRVIVFCISAFLAGIGGVLYGGTVNFASSADVHFGSYQSLVLLAILILAPFAEPWYAIAAGAAAVIPAYVDSTNTSNWLNVLFGVFAVLVSVQRHQPGVPAGLRSVAERFRRVPGAGAAAPERVERPKPTSAKGLEVESLSVRFGGLLAVDDLTFCAPLGRITGLIGPNGAGKTTTFDACSGLNRRVQGRVRLHGDDVTRLGPAVRGRQGLGRTFQRMQLGDSLTVLQNVALGAESAMAGRSVLAQLVAPPRQRREIDAATADALELCGISHLAALQAGALSTGQRRLVELARCVAGPFDVLMLDEPSSGLDKEETAAFDEVLRHVVSDRGCGILLVEHDVNLVMNVCDYIYVVDFGRLLFEGDPSAVSASPLVREAYLGTGDVLAGKAQEAST